MSIQYTHTEKGLHAQAGAWSKRIVHILLMSNGSSLPKGTSTLRPLGDAMGTPPAWPVTWSMIKNTQCTWHWQVDAYDAS